MLKWRDAWITSELERRDERQDGMRIQQIEKENVIGGYVMWIVLLRNKNQYLWIGTRLQVNKTFHITIRSMPWRSLWNGFHLYTEGSKIFPRQKLKNKDQHHTTKNTGIFFSSSTIIKAAKYLRMRDSNWSHISLTRCVKTFSNCDFLT